MQDDDEQSVAAIGEQPDVVVPIESQLLDEATTCRTR